MIETRIVPVILSGGSGTRLWPVSRASFPKQLWPLISDRTMIQETALRADGPGFAPPIVVCNQEHRFLIAEQLRAAGIEGARIVLEPVGRNSAPAIAAAALLVAEDNPDAVLWMMAADSSIADLPALQTALAAAVAAARTGRIVTFGMKPTSPEVGYGYIEVGSRLSEHDGVHELARFVEKPDAATAAELVASGRHLWNSGMFAISPQGHLLVRESPLASAERKPSKALLEAYGESAVRGMLHSGSAEMAAVLPPSFEFARSIARLYLTNLCKAATSEPGVAIPQIPPPVADLERAVLQAPPMIGLEYLTAEVLAHWWRDLDSLTRGEIAKHPGGAQGYLRERNPQWRFVGRVTLHLAENKRSPDYPFAFLATFANGLTPQGKVKHEPLGRALQQFAGEQNREAMLHLLLPILKAAESSELIRRLVDTGEIYHPLAWLPREAYGFLKAIPLLESSGLIVRVPDWWNAPETDAAPRQRENRLEELGRHQY